MFWVTTGSSVARVRKYPSAYTERTTAELRPIRPSVIRLRLRHPSPAAGAIASADCADTGLKRFFTPRADFLFIAVVLHTGRGAPQLQSGSSKGQRHTPGVGCSQPINRCRSPAGYGCPRYLGPH